MASVNFYCDRCFIKSIDRIEWFKQENSQSNPGQT